MPGQECPGNLLTVNHRVQPCFRWPNSNQATLETGITKNKRKKIIINEKKREKFARPCVSEYQNMVDPSE